MEIQIKATEKLTRVDGVPCRVWEGTTARGIRCIVFVHRVAVHNNDDSSQFDQELQECTPPGMQVALRDILK